MVWGDILPCLVIYGWPVDPSNFGFGSMGDMGAKVNTGQVLWTKHRCKLMLFGLYGWPVGPHYYGLAYMVSLWVKLTVVCALWVIWGGN